MHTIITHFNNSFNALHRGVLKKWSPVTIYNNSPKGGGRGWRRSARGLPAYRESRDLLLPTVTWPLTLASEGHNSTLFKYLPISTCTLQPHLQDRELTTSLAVYLMGLVIKKLL